MKGKLRLNIIQRYNITSLVNLGYINMFVDNNLIYYDEEGFYINISVLDTNEEYKIIILLNDNYENMYQYKFHERILTNFKSITYS